MNEMYTTDIINNDIRILNSIRVPVEFSEDIIKPIQIVINDMIQLRDGLEEYSRNVQKPHQEEIPVEAEISDDESR